MMFELKTFHDLSVSVLYGIMKLRAQVFVVEQNCVYLDPDDLDQNARHVISMNGEEVVAYCRILAPGVNGPEPRIGRVVVGRTHRVQGLGSALMQFAIGECRKLYEQETIVISAQAYLADWYTKMNFVQDGVGYLEDGIPHIEMKLTK